MSIKNLKWGLLMLMAFLFFSGCTHGQVNNEGQVQIYPFSRLEPSWVRNGEPIVFESKKYFPVNDYEVIEDGEVLKIEKYKGVSVFVEKIDTKPYPRLYTKFGRNKFRYWEGHND